MNRSDDERIVLRVLDGEPAAFGLLVDRYQRSVVLLAGARCGDLAEAEDIAQEAFVSAFSRLAELRRPDAFGSWLMQITVRLSKDHLRRVASRDRALAAVEPKCGPMQVRRSLDPHEQHLADAIGRLPEPQRSLILMRYFEGLTVREIAEVTGKGHEAVKRQLTRTLQRLRNALKPEKPHGQRH